MILKLKKFLYRMLMSLKTNFNWN